MCLLDVLIWHGPFLHKYIIAKLIALRFITHCQEYFSLYFVKCAPCQKKVQIKVIKITTAHTESSHSIVSSPVIAWKQLLTMDIPLLPCSQLTTSYEWRFMTDLSHWPLLYSLGMNCVENTAPNNYFRYICIHCHVNMFTEVFVKQHPPLLAPLFQLSAIMTIFTDSPRFMKMCVTKFYKYKLL
jgi:hypothetical protein